MNNARRGIDSRLEFLVKGCRGIVSGENRGEIDIEDVPGFKAWIIGKEPPLGLGKQGSEDEKEQAQRNLCGDQHAPEPRPPAARSYGGSTPFQRFR